MSDPALNEWLETALPGLLRRFLPEQRWFGGKARDIAGVDFEDASWVADAPRPCTLVVCVRYTEGHDERYAFLLAFERDKSGLPVVGRLDWDETELWAVEKGTLAAELQRMARRRMNAVLRDGVDTLGRLIELSLFKCATRPAA